MDVHSKPISERPETLRLFLCPEPIRLPESELPPRDLHAAPLPHQNLTHNKMNNTFLMSMTRGILVISVSMMMVFGLNSCSKDELLDDNFNASPSASKNGNLQNLAGGGTSTWGDDDGNDDQDDDNSNSSNDSDDNSSNDSSDDNSNSSNDSSDDNNDSNDDNGSGDDDDNGGSDDNNDDDGGDDDGSDD